MTLVSHQHKFIFLKTVKTAGTSLEMALEPLCMPPGHEPVHHSDGYVSEYGIVGSRKAKKGRSNAPFGAHTPAAQVRKHLTKPVFDSYFKLSCLRNPFDKAVSWYYFQVSTRIGQEKGREAKLAWINDKPTEEHIQSFRRFIRAQEEQGYFKSRKDRDWRVCFINKKCQIDYFLKMETLRDDLDAFARRIGVAPETIKLASVKRTSRQKSTVTVADYFTEETADIIRRGQDWIFEMGNYSSDPAHARQASEVTIA